VSVDVTAEIHGYSHPDAQPTPWSVGREQVIGADTMWVSTVRPDGRPHGTPLIAVWHREALWFSTGSAERKARNLASNPSCVLTTGRSEFGGLDVVLEGVAEQVSDEGELELVAAAFAAKYGTRTWDFVVRDGAFSHRRAGGRALVFRVRPQRGWGFDKGAISSQTTWRFPDRAVR
jgi:hypothetical protein